jgi:hypothetical protein
MGPTLKTLPGFKGSSHEVSRVGAAAAAEKIQAGSKV